MITEKLLKQLDVSNDIIKWILKYKLEKLTFEQLQDLSGYYVFDQLRYYSNLEFDSTGNVIKFTFDETDNYQLEYDTDSNVKFIKYSDSVIQRYYKEGNCFHVIYPDDFQQWFDYDSTGNVIYYRDSSGFEFWKEYVSGNMVHYEDSTGYQEWYEYDSSGNMIHQKNTDTFEEFRYYDSNNNLIELNNNDKHEFYTYEFYDSGQLKQINNIIIPELSNL